MNRAYNRVQFVFSFYAQLQKDDEEASGKVRFVRDSYGTFLALCILFLFKLSSHDDNPGTKQGAVLRDKNVSLCAPHYHVQR